MRQTRLDGFLAKTSNRPSSQAKRSIISLKSSSHHQNTNVGLKMSAKRTQAAVKLDQTHKNRDVEDSIHSDSDGRLLRCHCHYHKPTSHQLRLTGIPVIFNFIYISKQAAVSCPCCSGLQSRQAIGYVFPPREFSALIIKFANASCRCLLVTKKLKPSPESIHLDEMI